MADTRVHEAATAPAGGPQAPGGPAADSLFKNAYFLMLSTGVSAVLGLGFWLVAARHYSEEAVGQGSAAIAAMRLLAGITATTMIGAVVRFVPRAGPATASLVWRTYAASSVVVALAALVFLCTLDLWGASYAPLGTPLAGAVFVAACVAWALLTLQDGVLTGLRKAAWVPAGNAVFSAGKLVLLAVLAGTLPVLGVFVSWAVAIAFSTVPIGWLIFRRLIPRQAAADRHLPPPGPREVGRFLAGDSLGALFSLAMINLLPVMVAVRFSAAENGYFYVAYTVGGTMEFLAINMASSLTAHASHDPRHLADGVRGALRRMAVLLVPVVLVLVVFAPRILTPFDDDYAEHGSAVLRLLALGALPRVVVELYIGVLRVQGRTGVLAVVQGAMCALVLGSAAVLFIPAGIAGAGWAVMLSMTVVAAGCVPGLRRALRGTGGDGGPADPGPTGVAGHLRGDREPGPGTPAYGTRWARLNATAGYGTTWARRAAYEHGRGDGEAREDTVALFIGVPGYEREALEADTLAVIVRPRSGAGQGQGRPEGRQGRQGRQGPGAGGVTRPPGAGAGADAGADCGAGAVSAAETRSPSSEPSSEPSSASTRPVAGPPSVPSAPASSSVSSVESGGWGERVSEERSRPEKRPVPPSGEADTGARSEGAREREPARCEAPAPSGGEPAPRREAPATDSGERRLRLALWVVLGLTTAVFWATLGDLPWWGDDPSGTGTGIGTAQELSGLQLLGGLPVAALIAGGLLLVVFVAAVTLSTRREPWLPGAALASAVLALYAAPVALGREPRPVGGAWYAETAGFLADAVGLAGPGPLLRWAPLVFQLLCLVPLGLLLGLLANAGGRLPWPGHWGVLYLAAVGGWVWRQALAPVAPPLLLLLGLAVLVVLLLFPSARRSAPTTDPPNRTTTDPPHRTTTDPPHRTPPNGSSRD